MSLIRALPLLLLPLWQAGGQRLLTPESTQRANALFERPPGDSLECDMQTQKPFLDFAFRYEVGYVVRCPLKQFAGEEDGLGLLIRVRNSAGEPTLLLDQYRIPAMPAKTKESLDPKRFRGEVEMSGVFAAGEGEYRVDILLVDKHGRSYRHGWKAKAWPQGDERKIEAAMKPGAVTALDFSLLPLDPLHAEKGPRLTVLLDAAPLWPFANKLRAWDRAFLLDSLNSLLRQMPAASIRLVAFNLDQQSQILKEDHFDRAGYWKLAEALRGLELGTVSYTVLQRRLGWAELLTKLVDDETTAQPASDAIIFLGPATRYITKIPKEVARERRLSADQRLFYFEYYPQYGAEFSDVIHALTSSYKGRVFKLHTPGELADDIKKMRMELEREPETRAQ